MFVLVVLAVVTSTVTALQVTDEEYYELPRLFHLDNWEECAAKEGMYCLGTFDLMPYQNDRLYNVIQHVSTDRYRFNHTRIHRGLCLPSSCVHFHDPSPRAQFSACVNKLTRDQYGLETNLTQLQYCRTAGHTRSLDQWDLTFLYVAGMLLLANVVGTAYHLMASTDGTLIKQLMAWSVVDNWRRLTADHSEGGDTRLSALKPIQGMKALTLVLVMLAHSVLAYHLTYLYNPRFFEKSSHHILSAYLQNGTSIVQTFIMVSSFLLAYNLLLHVSDNPKKQFSMKMFPRCLLHRIARISPLYVFVLGLATTWWAHAGDGPLWTPMVRDEAAHCRDKWWAQVLFVNNFIKPEDRCLIHTWFLAVDMQLYIICAVFTLLLGRRPRVAVKILAVCIFGSMLMNFAIIYNWKLKPMVLLMIPELMRTQFPRERSFTWLYSAPWDSLPSALIGLLAAFLHYCHQEDGYQPAQSRCIRILYRLSVPCMFLWVVGGYWMKGVTHPLIVPLYATIDRPVFVTLTAFAMYGFINKIDSVWWKFLSWRGWEILGRMSLSIYLIHWLIALMLLAQRTNTNRAAVFDIGCHWLGTIFLSYCAAIPLHLLVELPAMRFLQSLAM
ncbi:nose resistant to fluoxetine protein 6-like [Spodoptera litura]|uniref:Nose resistant to fluoxetine protein 6-like n=1 Tax=Spodoptera litura TaxID=69820 RepID=A0A9J7J0B6_SPOLT|nr:nose resistant to fluoxetine protein 6-like [Spodoptera litura]